MKILKYNLCTRRPVFHFDPVLGKYFEQIEEVLFPVEMGWNEVNEEIAKAEAYKGEYTIEDDGVSPYPTAPHNIMEGECVIINDVMYKAIANIPNGEPVIVGQNAIETTIEAQLLELKGE